ncbi:MAG: TatD family hydrolase [Deltaproteobacteria bacterium]|nr:TatD family hydrolase [Deltaproteobacteria bacterium]
MRPVHGGGSLVLIDAHAHLDEIDDLEQSVSQARAVGVAAIVGVGMTLESNRRILAIARKYPGLVFPAIGYHPWEIHDETVEQTLAYIERHLPSCVALGEVGLDYKARVKKALQKEILSRLLETAHRQGKPAILHCRFSHESALAIVRDAGLEKAVFHWYSGNLETLRKILDQGYLISATPALAYSLPQQEAVRHTPLEMILIETDTPVEYRGRASRPADVVRTAELVAEIRGEAFERVAERTTQNAVGFYGIDLESEGGRVATDGS